MSWWLATHPTAFRIVSLMLGVCNHIPDFVCGEEHILLCYPGYLIREIKCKCSKKWWMEKKNSQKVSIKFCNDVWAGDMVNEWYGCIGAIGVFRSCRRERFPVCGAICLACFLPVEWFFFPLHSLWSDLFCSFLACGAIRFSTPQPVEQFCFACFYSLHNLGTTAPQVGEQNLAYGLHWYVNCLYPVKSHLKNKLHQICHFYGLELVWKDISCSCPSCFDMLFHDSMSRLPVFLWGNCESGITVAVVVFPGLRLTKVENN